MHPKPQQIIAFPECEVHTFHVKRGKPIEVSQKCQKQSDSKPEFEALPPHPRDDDSLNFEEF